MKKKFHSFHLGVDVRMVGEGKKLMHHKFCLIDCNRWINPGTVISGSLNWSYTVSIVSNFEIFWYCLNICICNFCDFFKFFFRVLLRTVKMFCLLKTRQRKKSTDKLSMMFGKILQHQYTFKNYQITHL